jgi:hypothetical protein
MYKISNGQLPFKLVYGPEVVVPLQFCANAGRITFVLEFKHMINTRQHLYHLNKLEEERMLSQQHQETQKNQPKNRNDLHIKNKDMHYEDFILLYDSRVKGKLRKLETPWLGPYVVKDILPIRVVQLNSLQGNPLKNYPMGLA